MSPCIGFPSPNGVGDVIEEMMIGSVAESSGTFSLDPAAAVKKLATFQFSDPYYYVLKLLQAASWGGASRVDLRIGARGVTFSCDAAELETEQLDQILAFALAKEPSYLKALGAGLVGARGLSPSSCRLESGSTAVELAGASPGRVRGEFAGGWRFRLKRGRQQWWRNIRSRSGQPLQSLLLGDPDIFQGEGRVVHRNCHFHRARVYVNGLPLRESSFGEPAEHHRERHYQAAEGSFRAPGVCGAQQTFNLCLGQTVETLLALRPGPSEVFFVCHGVVVAIVSHPRPDFAAVVDAARLNTDISGLELLRDEAYEAVMEDLRRMADLLEIS